MTKRKDPAGELQQRFQILADTAPVMVWMSGPDKLRDFFNEGWLRFTGRTSAQELGNGWIEDVHPDDVERCVAAYGEAFDAHRPFAIEYRLRRQDGAFRWILEHGVPRHAPSGEFAGFIGSCVDVHEQRETRDRLEDTLARQQLLIREIHHRVRNNLQLAVSLISNSRRRFEQKDVREELSGVQQRLLSMARIYDKVFRGTAQRRLDLGEHVGEVAAALRDSRIREDVSIEVEARAVPAHIDVAISISLIATELVMNALRHGFTEGEGGTVRVSLSDGKEARLVVSDDGSGNAAEADRHAIGLVRLLAAQIKGRLDIVRDGGTRFILIFDPRGGDETPAGAMA
jgi:PAS domain S-box-containing protein